MPVFARPRIEGRANAGATHCATERRLCRAAVTSILLSRSRRWRRHCVDLSMMRTRVRNPPPVAVPASLTDPRNAQRFSTRLRPRASGATPLATRRDRAAVGRRRNRLRFHRRDRQEEEEQEEARRAASAAAATAAAARRAAGRRRHTAARSRSRCVRPMPTPTSRRMRRRGGRRRRCRMPTSRSASASAASC